ncbi:Centromere protein S [Holothuria leucospilota]|uniref:Centromere protein S n=1 Tax=Holothuria leucospilota TaxID=206669 RepID=A0A9Q1CEC9_HOLLE|nr:Centromere protein S [Holothuria leucospilota]
MEEQSDGEASDSEKLALDQRFKAAIHYTVGKICTELEEEMEVTFSRHIIAVISEATYKQSGIFASDLEDFCQHAKRTTVTADDVKLLARRSGTLANHISKVHKKMKDAQVASKEKKGQKRKKTGP